MPTIDERAWRATEPHTPHPAARLEAVAKLTPAGIPTSVLIAPLMPGINDDPGLVREIVRRARDAGARSVTPIALHLRAGVREVFMDWLEASIRSCVERYEELYGRGAYAPAGRASQARRAGARARPAHRRAFRRASPRAAVPGSRRARSRGRAPRRRKRLF